MDIHIGEAGERLEGRRRQIDAVTRLGEELRGSGIVIGIQVFAEVAERRLSGRFDEMAGIGRPCPEAEAAELQAAIFQTQSKTIPVMTVRRPTPSV